MSAISVTGLTKTYSWYRRPGHRLLEVVTGKSRHEEFTALHPVTLEVAKGEVVGLIGRNGAGKSTFLKIVAGALQPSAGEIEVNGQVAALLELGSGFHPDMTARDNVYLSGAIRGLSRARVSELYDDIVRFAEVEGFMDKPIKMFSSGMYMRLAFAVATCEAPEILIVDEALSVGDGAFARKSFDRIMQIRDSGCSILFCSHSMYQVEAICSRAIWLDAGRVREDGPASDVVAGYSHYLASKIKKLPAQEEAPLEDRSDEARPHDLREEPVGIARLGKVEIVGDADTDSPVVLRSLRDELTVRLQFHSDPAHPVPALGVAITTEEGLIVTSVGTRADAFAIGRDAEGTATVEIAFPKIDLLKGKYYINAYVFCEQGIHIYDQALATASFRVVHDGPERGFFLLDHDWRNLTLPAAES